MHHSILAGAVPQILLGELTSLSRPPSRILEVLRLRRERGGKERKGEWGGEVKETGR